MMTTLALVALVALTGAEDADSALGLPLRAESAANGETEFDRADAGSSRRALVRED
jgi:hypothetical protein